MAIDWRALTVHQPWAWAIAEEFKPVENRGGRPPAALVGEWIAIHAGLKYDKIGARAMRSIGTVPPPPAEVASGAIIAVAVLAGWVDTRGELTFAGLSRGEAEKLRRSPWFCGPVGIALSRVIKLDEPIPLRGFQGWPRVPAEIASRLDAVIA